MPEHTHSLGTISEGASSAIQLAKMPEHSHPEHRRCLISHLACLKMPECTHILTTFSEGAPSVIQLARRHQKTLTSWTHFQKMTYQPSNLPEDARAHLQTGHIFRTIFRSLISYPACQNMPEHAHKLDTFSESHPACQNMPEHTHSLDTFSERVSSVIQLARKWKKHSLSGHIFRSLISHVACQYIRTHSHTGHIFRRNSSAIQLARTGQNMLTNWTHFQKEPHQSSSLPEDARTHSLPGHFQKEPHQPSSLPKDARTHSLSRHIFRKSLISHPVCQKMPEHTHSLDTFSEKGSSASLPEDARTHLLPGHIFRRGLLSNSACQKMPEHTHSLDTFSEEVLSAIQLVRICQNTLTPWTHFQKEPH